MTDKIQPSEMVHTKCSCVNCGEITHRDAPLSATISMGTVCRYESDICVECGCADFEIWRQVKLYKTPELDKLIQHYQSAMQEFNEMLKTAKISYAENGNCDNLIGDLLQLHENVVMSFRQMSSVFKYSKNLDELPVNTDNLPEIIEQKIHTLED